MVGAYGSSVQAAVRREANEMIKPVYPEDYLLKHRRPGRLLLRPQRAGRVRGVRIRDTGRLWAVYKDKTITRSYDTRAQAAQARHVPRWDKKQGFIPDIEGAKRRYDELPNWLKGVKA